MGAIEGYRPYLSIPTLGLHLRPRQPEGWPPRGGTRRSSKKGGTDDFGPPRGVLSSGVQARYAARQVYLRRSYRSHNGLHLPWKSRRAPSVPFSVLFHTTRRSQPRGCGHHQSVLAAADEPVVLARHRSKYVVATALASIVVGQHLLLRRALSDRSLTPPFIGLPDQPKRNQEGSAQLHGIVTTLSRSAHGWEPYRLGRIQKASSLRAG